MHKKWIVLLAGLLSSGCAQLGIKSVPWFTSTEVHDKEALAFLRNAPAIDADLGKGVGTRDMFADGRLVGLSVSGGGARAAAFTLGVLTGLQELSPAGGPNVLDQVDFISSNSGGSWGVAAYLHERSAIKDPGYELAAAVPTSLIPRLVAMSRGVQPCWHRTMRKHLFHERTYRQTYSGANGALLARVFFNASLLPAHAPFVFNYFFVRYYRVERFGACADGDWVRPGGGIADVPFGYAAVTSSMVPGFYHAFAQTGLCRDESPMRAASFCHPQKGGRRSYLRLADGGLYDNIGYKTAYELMLSQRKEAPTPDGR